MINLILEFQHKYDKLTLSIDKKVYELSKDEWFLFNYNLMNVNIYANQIYKKIDLEHKTRKIYYFGINDIGGLFIHAEGDFELCHDLLTSCDEVSYKETINTITTLINKIKPLVGSAAIDKIY